MAQTRKDFLIERRSGLGGSDMGPVMGFSAFKKTAADIWDEKVAVVVGDKPPTPDMERGRIQEPIAISRYQTLSGRKTRSQGMRRHKKYPCIIAHVDQQQISDPRGPGILEVKVPRLPTFMLLKAQGLQKQFQQYIIQIQTYLEVFEYDWGTFAFYNADTDKLIYFDIDRDKELGQQIVEAGVEFWEKYVVPRVRPPEPPAPEYDLPEIVGDIKMVDDPVFAEKLSDMWGARELLAAAKELKDVTDKAVKEAMSELLDGGYGTIETPNSERLWLKQMPGRTGKFQHERLAQVGPLDAIAVAAKLQTHGFTVEEIEAWVQDTLLDLTPFQGKPGKPYDRFTPYQLKRVVKEE